jgi:hypothetical protein
MLASSQDFNASKMIGRHSAGCMLPGYQFDQSGCLHPAKTLMQAAKSSYHRETGRSLQGFSPHRAGGGLDATLSLLRLQKVEE